MVHVDLEVAGPLPLSVERVDVLDVFGPAHLVNPWLPS